MVRTLAFNKKGFFLCLSFLILLIFTACSAQEKPDDGRLKVYTSFYPVYDFAAKIGGDKINLKNIVPGSAEPHDWEPTPKDMQLIADADMLIYSGYGMEQWLEKLTAAAENDALLLVEAGEGVITENTDGGIYDTDPHIWISIKNAVLEMENIKNALCQADSENASYYEDNFMKYKAEFEALDKEFEEFVSGCDKKDIIVSHAAFSYLCQDYGLNQIAISGLSPEEEPEPSRMAEIVDLAKQNDIKCIFFEPNSDKKAAQILADEIGAEMLELNPLECLSEAEQENGNDYLSIMRKNFQALKEALK